MMRPNGRLVRSSSRKSARSPTLDCGTPVLPLPDRRVIAAPEIPARHEREVVIMHVQVGVDSVVVYYVARVGPNGLPHVRANDVALGHIEQQDLPRVLVALLEVASGLELLVQPVRHDVPFIEKFAEERRRLAQCRLTIALVGLECPLERRQVRGEFNVLRILEVDRLSQG